MIESGGAVYLSITIQTNDNEATTATALRRSPAVTQAGPNIMMEYLLPGSITTPQAQALASILAITRREWQVAEGGSPGPAERHNDAHTGPAGQPREGHAGRAAGCSAAASADPGSRQHRREQFARRAARAFEAQVMALRCRQAFVL